MKNSKVLKAILVVAGLVASVIGSSIVTMPETFYETNGIELAGNVSLLNEIRAAGAALLAMGLFIISGAFVSRLTFTSTLVAALLYLSYGLSRILSMAIDGLPAEGLLQAAVLELVIGLVCVFALAGYRLDRKEYA